MAGPPSILDSEIRSRLCLFTPVYFADMNDRTHRTYAVLPPQMRLRRRPSQPFAWCRCRCQGYGPDPAIGSVTGAQRQKPSPRGSGCLTAPVGTCRVGGRVKRMGSRTIWTYYRIGGEPRTCSFKRPASASQLQAISRCATTNLSVLHTDRRCLYGVRGGEIL